VRPIPRPGLRILRRDLRTLQAGLEWSGAATLSDSAAMRAVLRAVDGMRDVSAVTTAASAAGVPATVVRAALDALLAAGVVVDGATVRPPQVDERLWAAWWLLSGPAATAADVASSRADTRVWVAGEGRVADTVRRVLSDERVPPAANRADATVMVLASDTEMSREAADEAMRRDIPFLCVSLRDLVGVIGPFVVPGRTACLRCVDRSRSHHDRSWPTVIASVEAAPLRVPAVSPALAAMTGGYAASELTLWATGYVPTCRDAVVELPHGLGPVQTVSYPLDPECGCGWELGRATMSA
jgi:bacteriocin biosynthesis cyclodehydratase domain-containing protein